MRKSLLFGKIDGFLKLKGDKLEKLLSRSVILKVSVVSLQTKQLIYVDFGRPIHISDVLI